MQKPKKREEKKVLSRASRQPQPRRSPRRRAAASAAGTTDRELELLSIVRDSDEPIGSWALMGVFEERGVSLSPATFGRLLTQLEKEGYLERKSYKGRVITEKGIAAIVQAQSLRQMETYRKRLEDLLSSRVLRHFLMVLGARKAIEREAVFLAAKNITKKEIARLEELERMREYNDRRYINDPAHDIEIHRIIAHASRNDALVVFSEIVMTMRQQSAVFDSMRMRMERPYFISHRKIIEALKAHDPKAAAKSMVQHIETLIRDVNEYSKVYIKKKR